MTEVLQIVLYSLGSILLIVLIILGIKLIVTVDKINVTVDNINTKISSLNGFFQVIDFTSNKIATLSDKLVDNISSLIAKVFIRKKEEEDDYE